MIWSDPGLLAAFIAAAFVVTIVPGVTVSAIVSTTLARGMAAGFWLEAGVNLGRASMVLVVAVALEAVTSFVGVAFDFIKYAGAAYLAWLGWGYLTSRITVAISSERAIGQKPWRQMLSGFVVLWTNPKALLFFGAFLPQFVQPGYPAFPQVLALGAIEIVAGIISDSVYIVLAATARSVLVGRGAVALNRAAGLVLIGAAIWLALSHR